MHAEGIIPVQSAVQGRLVFRRSILLPQLVEEY